MHMYTTQTKLTHGAFHYVYIKLIARLLLDF